MTYFPFYSQLRSLILPSVALSSALPKEGKIIDLGCGQGLLSTYIASVKTRNVIGVDLDSSRIPKNKLKNLRFVNADIRSFNLEGASGAVLSDVLHHLSKKDQRKILENISKTIKKGGVLAIKEIDTGEFFRSKLSRFWDFILYPKDKIEYWSAAGLKKFLTDFGFEVKIIRPCRFFPGSTTLFICQK